MFCPACFSDRCRALAAPRRRFFRCSVCLCAWADPAGRPTAEQEGARYARHRNAPDDPRYVAYLAAVVDSAVAGGAPSAGRALDWGCGPAPVLAGLLAARGYAAVAWDPVFAADRPAPRGDRDAAFCVEVAEHFADPGRGFAELAACLAPGGTAAVHTQPVPANDEDFLAWWYAEDPTHLTFYTDAALRRLAPKAGFLTPRRVGRELWLFVRGGGGPAA